MNNLAGDLLFKVIFEYDTIFSFLNTFKTTSSVVAAGSEQITDAVNEVNKSFEGLSGVAKNLPGINIAFNSFVSVLSTLTSSVSNIQQTNRILGSLTRSEEELADAQQYMLDTANKYGVAVDDISTAYVKLFKLQSDGKLSAQDTKSMYEGLIGFSKKTGVDSKDLTKSLGDLFNAMSEGTIRADTLRRVTAPLPGLLGDIETATGMGTVAFNKMLEAGQLTSETFGKTLVFALQKYQTANQSFQNDTKKISTELESKLNRLQNQLSVFKAELSTPFTETLTPIIDFLVEKIEEATSYIQTHGNNLKRVATNIESASRPLINATIVIMGKLSEVFIAVLPYLVRFVEIIAAAIKWIADFIVDNTTLVLTLYSLYKIVQMLIWVLGILGKIKLGLLVLEFIGLQKVMAAVRLAMIGLSGTSIIAFFGTLIGMVGSLIAALGYLAYSMYAIVRTPLGMALTALSIGLYAVYSYASSSREELDKVAEATRKNIEVLAKFRDATEELKKVNAGDDVIAEINHIRAAVMVGRIAEEDGLRAVRTLVNAVRDAEAARVAEIQRNESEIANKRQTTADLLVELNKIQEEEAKKVEEAKAAEAEKSLQAILEGRKKFDLEVLRSAKLTGEKLVELEKSAADKIKSLQEELAKAKLSTADKIRELRRKEMSDFDAQADLEAQISEKMVAAREALETGDSQKSRALASEIENLVGNIDDTEKAVSLLQQVSQLTQDSISNNISEVQKFSDELGKTEGVKGVKEVEVQAKVDNALKELDTLEKKLALLKNKTIHIDVVQVLSEQEKKVAREKAEAEAAARIQARGGSEEEVAAALKAAADTSENAAGSQQEAADSLKDAASSLKDAAATKPEATGFATGGPVPGIGDTDTVPALLTPGEFVVKKERSQLFSGFLNALNFAPLEVAKQLTTGIQRFNAGGLVKSLPRLKFAEGGEVPALAPAVGPLEVIRFEWNISGQRGAMNTLASERANLSAFLNAVRNVGRGL
jgi:tape measure domain-containing protein